MIQLVRNYLKDFQEFGHLGFEIRVVSTHGAGQPTEYAILNEDQAYLLLAAGFRGFEIEENPATPVQSPYF